MTREQYKMQSFDIGREWICLYVCMPLKCVVGGNLKIGLPHFSIIFICQMNYVDTLIE